MPNRLEFQPDESKLSPVDETSAVPGSSAPVSAVPQPEGGNPFQRCSIPALTPVSADSLRQFLKSGIPQNRTMPLPILTPPRAPIKINPPTGKSTTTTTSPTPTQSTGMFPTFPTESGTSPGGQDKSVQVNSQGVFYGSPALTWDKVAGALAVTGTVSISGTTQIGAITDAQAAINSKVPQTTTVNGHALFSNVIISASDLTTGTLPHAQLPALLSSDIPNNSANTSGTAGGLSVNIAESQVTNLTTDLAARALTSTTVNGHALSANVVVSASDITTGTLPHAQLPALLSGDIPNNAANTSGSSGSCTGTAAGLTGTPNITVGTVSATSITGTGQLVNSAAGAASTPAVSITGAPYTAGGTGTTTVPLLYLNSGNAPSGWLTAGTMFGINAPSGFTGNFLDFRLNGGNSVFSINYLNQVNIGGSIATLTNTGGLSMAAGGTVNWNQYNQGTVGNPDTGVGRSATTAGVVVVGNGGSNDASGTIQANTGALNELSITQLATPVNATFSTATTGGTLNHSTTYYYRVAATDAVGTTLASTETSITTGGAANTCTVTVKWAKVTGAAGYKVYGRTTGAELFIASVSGSNVLSYTDTGSITPSGALPAVNSTGSITAPLQTPASSSATGTTGQIQWDANYIYVAVGTNSWKRAALSTF